MTTNGLAAEHPAATSVTPCTPPVAGQEPSREFSWNDDAVVVLHEQRATAIYRNTAGDLVIRQMAAWDEEHDPWIVVTKNNEQEFLDALCSALGVPSFP